MVQIMLAMVQARRERRQFEIDFWYRADGDRHRMLRDEALLLLFHQIGRASNRQEQAVVHGYRVFGVREDDDRKLFGGHYS
jgi:hypothetical protein